MKTTHKLEALNSNPQVSEIINCQFFNGQLKVKKTITTKTFKLLCKL